jgi:hypothetical protein
MDQLSIMRRANGELFTLIHKGQEHVPLWPSLKSAFHYKFRNPELLVFSPASVESSFGQKSLVLLQGRNVGLFLLNDTYDAQFRVGRKISWKELKRRLPAS